jgi:hypothetical protein
MKVSSVPIDRYANCKLAKPEKVAFYSECFPEEGKFVNIEGPEYIQDYSYFLCALSKPIRDLEKGIPIFVQSSINFKNMLKTRNTAMEFRTLERITLHQDHAENLVTISLPQF